jgi:hypothetical protein
MTILSFICSVNYIAAVPDLGGGKGGYCPGASTSKGGTQIERQGTTLVVNDLFL